MTSAEELRALARNAETCADDYARGLPLTPATAASLWRALARLADTLARDIEIGGHRSAPSPETRHRTAQSRKGSRGDPCPSTSRA
jgi:hypothetical protein